MGSVSETTFYIKAYYIYVFLNPENALEFQELSMISDLYLTNWDIFVTPCTIQSMGFPDQNTGGIQKTGQNPFSRGSSQPRDWTQVSSAAGAFFNIWVTREALQKPNKCQSWFLTHMVSDL